MLDCVSTQNMRESDAYTIENFVPSLTLMYRAAMGIYRAAQYKGETVIAAGSGNNGGDGFALACILAQNGFSCRVVTLSEKRSPDSAFYAGIAESLGVPVSPYAPGAFSGADVIADCLLGTGFHGKPRPPYDEAIREINGSPAFTVSADINSGMNGDTGEYEIAVASDITVTIGFIKRGLVTPKASEKIGRLVCADIGIRLLREEWKLVSPKERREEFDGDEKYILLPEYADTNIIDVSTLPLPEAFPSSSPGQCRDT
ncbi:MAG: NAD(P)H-hydrate epimerase [Oscillospiraceae bacterium]|nr:NAD(P)H-hydrate epimerase [Oscillospiraceae bacterium]